MLHIRVYENKRLALEGFKVWCDYHMSNIHKATVTDLKVTLYNGDQVLFKTTANEKLALASFQGYVIGTCEFIGNIRQDIVDYIKLRIRH